MITTATVSEHYVKAMTAYLSDLKVSSKSVATYTQYTQVLTDFGEWLKDKHGEEYGADVTPLMISEYKQELFAHGVKANTVLHYFTLIKAFFKWTIDNGFYNEQPIKKTAMPAAEQIQHDIPTLDEINLLLSGKIPPHSKRATLRRNRAIVTLFIQSGLRVSELCNLQIKDLDFKNSNVFVDHGKGNKSRYAPFPAPAQRSMTEYLNERKRAQRIAFLKPCDYVFIGDDKDKPLTRQGVTKLVRGYVQRLTGHDGIGSHDLRHAAASIWDDRGANIRDVQKALGHSKVETTERVYVQILDKKKAAETISKIF